MRGRTLVIAGAILLAVFTAALWYFQTRAFYSELSEEPLSLGDQTYPVIAWQGIDARTSPLKRRICLRVSAETATRIRTEQGAAAGGEPLVAPSWFECFDARQLSRDLAARTATLHAVESSGHTGIDTFLALYPDGRGYIWRQLAPEFRDR